MPNNFRITGNIYVSKAGNDANAGTSPDAPKRTVASGIAAARAITGTLIIGNGVYSENAIYDVSLTTIWGDGVVVFDGENTKKTEFFLVRNSGNTINNITVRNYSYRFFLYNVDSRNGVNNPVFNNCTFINTSFYLTNSTQLQSTFNFCKFINCTIETNGAYTTTTMDFNKCLFVNCNVYQFTSILNSYFYSGLLISRPSLASPTFNYNFFNDSKIAINAASTVTSGVIQDVYGNYYDLSLAGSGGSGSISEPYKRDNTISKPFYFNNHRIAYPLLNPSSSIGDPKFNSIEDQDFTVQSNSPLLSKASDGSNIGSVTFATRRTAKISFSGSLATVDPSLIFQYDNYIISGSQVTGSVTSAPIAVNTSVPKVIQKVTYNGLLAFNKDTGSASGSNQNVPDFDTFTSASLNAAANPDRLVYYMRHTTGSSIPVTDAGWENGGLWTAGQYNVFEWNTKPSIDNNGVGNGSGSFNAAVTPTFIQATYVQMQVKLRNDYLL